MDAVLHAPQIAPLFFAKDPNVLLGNLLSLKASVVLSVSLTAHWLLAPPTYHPVRAALYLWFLQMDAVLHAPQIAQSFFARDPNVPLGNLLSLKASVVLSVSPTARWLLVLPTYHLVRAAFYPWFLQMDVVLPARHQSTWTVLRFFVPSLLNSATICPNRKFPRANVALVAPW